MFQYMDNTNISHIKELYSNQGYFDQYGGSIILFIVITLITILLWTYIYIMINIEPIKNDWTNQRCNPYVIPFAGYINKPDNMTANEFTKQNFEYCSQDVLKGVTGPAIEPLNYILNIASSFTNNIQGELNSIREMFYKIRTFSQTITEEIMGRLLNVVVPLQSIIVSFKDLLSKVQGIMVSALYTLLGSYFSLKTLMATIAQFIVAILIAMSILIAGFWALPFTWGAAIANTTIFMSISIPFALVLSFMVNVLGVKTTPGIPKLKCFDENCEFEMNDGNIKKIKDICIGDILKNNNMVTATIKVEKSDSIMYDLNGTIISDSHLVKLQNEKWIRVCKHPDSKIVYSYNKPFLYCLNTSKKVIETNNNIFSDWDEIDSDECNFFKNLHDYNVLNTNKLNIPTKYEENDYSIIHSFFDGGFLPTTYIKLYNGQFRFIRDIQVGDILQNGDKVYGIVQIDGLTMDEQYDYYLGKQIFSGGLNLNICQNDKILNTLKYNNKEECIIKYHTLHHLLTDTKTFWIENIKFYDYNSSIDLLLDKK
jgi:hypothetical protein